MNSVMIIIGTLTLGGLGAVARYAVCQVIPFHPGRINFGVLLVNGVGSLMAGIVLGLAERGGVSEEIRLMLATGFCGGLTTFSTFAVDTTVLLGMPQRNRIANTEKNTEKVGSQLAGMRLAAAGNVLANLILGFGVAGLGYFLAR